jgi:hypothetical protein
MSIETTRKKNRFIALPESSLPLLYVDESLMAKEEKSSDDN